MRVDKDFWLFTRPVAHRGLWGNGIIENSLTAYENAAKNGYPIEIDVYSTTDGHLVSFHDSTLTRMTGENGFIYEKTLAELKSLSLNGSNEKIPTLNEVFEIACGRVPLLIEIKNQPAKNIVESVVAALKNYKGEFAVQSFNPLYINKVRKLAPEFIRGILGTEDARAQGESVLNAFIVKNMPFNGLIKPDFISYHQNGLNLIKRKAKTTPVIAWTVLSEKERKSLPPFVRNIIFENFIPE